MSTDNLHCFGALAIEHMPQHYSQHTVLTQPQASELASLIAADLAGFVPAAGQLDLALIGAHFDPVELLRPRWPLHMALLQLAEAAPKSLEAGNGRIIAFGASTSNASRQLPTALMPDPDYLGSPLRLLPFALIGRADVVQTVGQRLEETLLDSGMASAATALQTQAAFGAQIEHSRYLTLHDLLAIMAMQYQHAGLTALWPLLETALLGDGEQAWLDQAPEPLIYLDNGNARMAMMEIDGWIEHGFASPTLLPSQLNTSFEHFQARQRQLAAVLRAHGIDVIFDYCGPTDDPRRVIAS